MENMAFWRRKRRDEFSNKDNDNDILQHPQVIHRHLDTLILFIVLDTFQVYYIYIFFFSQILYCLHWISPLSDGSCSHFRIPGTNCRKHFDSHEFLQPSDSVLEVTWVLQICRLSQFSFDFKEYPWSMYTLSFINSEGRAICL